MPFWLRGAAAIAIVLAAGCDNTPKEPLLVTPVEAQAYLQRGEKVLIADVRSEVGYRNEHIEGAISAPFAQIYQGQHTLPKDQWVLLYCT